MSLASRLFVVKAVLFWARLKKPAKKEGQSFPDSSNWYQNEKTKSINYVEAVQRALDNGELRSAVFSASEHKTIELESHKTRWSGFWRWLKREPIGIHTLNIAKCEALSLKGVEARHVIIHSQASENVKLNRCTIETLSVNGDRPFNIDLQGCWIGRFVITQRASLSSLSIRGGGLLDLTCPPQHERNPFSGNVTLKGVYLPRSRAAWVQSPQNWRNLHAHLHNMENVPAASMVLSAVLAQQRSDEALTAQLLSWLYELSSDFGNSPSLPLVWLLTLTALSIGTIGSQGGADLGVPPEQLMGWQKALLGDDSEASARRAVYLGFQPILNPFGWFKSNTIVIAPNINIQILLWIQSFLSAALIFLFFLAIRRRFKIR